MIEKIRKSSFFFPHRRSQNFNVKRFFTLMMCEKTRDLDRVFLHRVEKNSKISQLRDLHVMIEITAKVILRGTHQQYYMYVRYIISELHYIFFQID